jgi:hypothetical protein
MAEYMKGIPKLRKAEEHYNEQQIPPSQQHVHLMMAG